MKGSLLDVLKNLDDKKTAISEYEIASEINRNFSGNKNDFDFKAEIIAFNFSDDYENKSGSWGYYYGPYLVSKNIDGSIDEYPSLNDINKRMIDYWCKRMKMTNNSVMQARYADLVWEFKKYVTGDDPSYKIGHKVIDNNILVIENEMFQSDIRVIKRLKRTLNIALSLNDSVRIEKIKRLIITTEDKISKDNKPGLWGFSYDLLLNKKVTLDNNEETKIIKDLNNRMMRLYLEEEISPPVIESAAIRLASYYQKNNNKKAVADVMEKLRQFYEKKIKVVSPLQAQSWLGHLHEIFIQFQMTEEAEKVIREITRLGLQVHDELSESTFSVGLSSDEINTYINQFISDNITNDIQKISANFVPNKDEVEKQVKKLSESYPLVFLIPKELLNNEGIPIAKIGNIEEDLEGNIIYQITQNLTNESFFLDKTLDNFIKYHNLNVDKFLNILFESPVFERERSELLKKGLQMYFEKDYVSAMHILIPQIESAFRRVINLAGGITMMLSKDNEGYRVRLFGAILNDPIIEKIFGEDYKLYFKVLFSEKKGLNIRNNISHGLSNIEIFNKYNANLLIHILLTLSLVKTSN